MPDILHFVYSHISVSYFLLGFVLGVFFTVIISLVWFVLFFFFSVTLPLHSSIISWLYSLCPPFSLSLLSAAGRFPPTSDKSHFQTRWINGVGFVCHYTEDMLKYLYLVAFILDYIYNWDPGKNLFFWLSPPVHQLLLFRYGLSENTRDSGEGDVIFLANQKQKYESSKGFGGETPQNQGNP